MSRARGDSQYFRATSTPPWHLIGCKMKHKAIEILKVISLRGPGLWAYRPVLEAWIDIGELEDFPSDKLPGFPQRLINWIPSLIEHRCSVGERGGFIQRLHRGTWAGHILEHVALELQGLAGMSGGMGRAREASRRGVYKVVVSTWHEPATRAALYAARDLVMAAINDEPYNVEAAVQQLRDIAEPLRLGPSTACIADEAEVQEIPVLRLNDSNLVQLGYGAAQRRIWTAETDSTSSIAESISRDKALTKKMLSDCGVPVPEGRSVGGPDEAWEAAQEIGLPVVVKPSDGNHGRGVFTDLRSQKEVIAAYGVAVEEGSGVIVERYVEGNEHRLLVVGERMVAAARGEAAFVVGDGTSTVQALIDSQLNSDPRRGGQEDNPLNPVRVDSAVRLDLARQGLSADAIAPRDTRVLIQRNGNVAVDVTDTVHPSVADAVTLAARIVGLDIAGVDLVARDISRPLEEQQGAIVEVNAGPGLLMHLKPAQGKPQPVGKAIVEQLFPSSAASRIPVVGVTGSRGKTTVARMVAGMLQDSGLATGLACSQGLFLAELQLDGSDSATFDGGRRLLMNRAAEAAVIENSGSIILGEGLAYDRCAVGIITNIDASDQWPDFDILDVETMHKVYRTQVDVVLPDGYAVLSADDPAIALFAEYADGQVIFHSSNEKSSVIDTHRTTGGRAIQLCGNRLLLIEGASESTLAELPVIRSLAASGRCVQIEYLLAGIAAGWALGLKPDALRNAVAVFGPQVLGAAA